MLVIRILGLIALLAIGVSLALYVWSRDRKYLNLAWRVFWASLAMALVAGPASAWRAWK